MTAIVAGRYDARIRGLRASDEIGEMARATEVFRENAIAKRSAEVELLHAKERAETALKELRETQSILVESEKLSALGGMVMGIGAALMEDLVVDKRAGFFVNHDLAGYEVPVHADVPHLDAVFIDELDPTISPVQAKGIGEVGLTGVAPAIANAVYNATGIRVRDYPITLDKLLERLPEAV
jgi:xanthine dehydrogenase YagR molybdenum-binding subunit